jgi:TetR/AcrR family transcriptional regulator
LRAIIRKRDQYERGIREIIREGMAQGIFRDGDPKLLAFAILGAINWTVRWFSPQGPRSAQEIGEVFAEYLVRGLRAEKADGEARTSS